jgi:myo-inositol-1(or 4)-monophosphatase
MSTHEYEEIKTILLEVTQRAGEYASQHFGSLKKEQISYKLPGKKAPVTDIDIHIDTMIREAILSANPLHDIISEEKETWYGDQNVIWVIDPIDGTRNYINGRENYCVTIGVLIDSQLTFGTIYAPEKNEFFFAEKGKGSTLNGKPLVKESPESMCYIDEKRLFSKKVKKHFEGCTQVHLGSAALELAYVAQGKSMGSALENIMFWDVAAGILMIQEMGGRLENFHGAPYTLNDKDLLAFS